MENIISILIWFKQERLTEIYRLSDAAFYDHSNTIYQFIKPFLDKNCLFLEEYKALNIPIWLLILRYD